MELTTRFAIPKSIHEESNFKQATSKSNEDEANAITRTPDEEIKACFGAAKQKLDGLLKSRKQVIQDLARELELLGRRTEDIAAEIVHELRNCEELSRSCYLDDKYKNQTQAQRRKGKKESNPDPKTGTESSLEQRITVGNKGRQTIYNEHDSQELKEPADTPAVSVTSNQQSNLTNLQKSDWNPDPKTGTESLLPEQGTTQLEEASDNNALYKENAEQNAFTKANEISLHEIERIIPKEKYPNLEEAMQKSRDSIYVVFNKSGMFERAIPDIFRGDKLCMEIMIMITENNKGRLMDVTATYSRLSQNKSIKSVALMEPIIVDDLGPILSKFHNDSW